MIPRPGSSPPPLFQATLPLARPLLAYVFLGLIAVLYVLTEISGGPNRSVLMLYGANIAEAVTAGEYWRLVTASFLHWSPTHILFNGYALYSLGTQVESLFGPRRFAAVYLLSGVTGALLSYVITHGTSAGASTSIFGLFGALAVFYYKQRKILGGTSQRQLQQLGFILLLNLILGFSPGSNIDNWGHAGGLIGGLILAWFLSPDYVPTEPAAQSQAEILPSRSRPELSNAYITDANSLGRQAFTIAVFIAAVGALTFFAVLQYQ